MTKERKQDTLQAIYKDARKTPCRYYGQYVYNDWSTQCEYPDCECPALGTNCQESMIKDLLERQRKILERDNQ